MFLRTLIPQLLWKASFSTVILGVKFTRSEIFLFISSWDLALQFMTAVSVSHYALL